MSRLPGSSAEDAKPDASTAAASVPVVATDAAAGTPWPSDQVPLLGRKSFARGAMIGLAIVIPLWLLVAAVLLWVL